MNYKETLDYLFSRLPMFQRIGAAAYKANLDNTWALMNALDSPEKKIKSIHIAGTNGKGSTSHMLAAAFQQAGYKTGLYTSPHLIDFRERIKINGKMISKQAVVKFVEQHQKTFDQIEPSFFEWTVALAFDYFSRKKVDIAIVETGLGGRLDSTNVIHPELSIITNISFDHMNLLGATLPLIATEKAGIIKENTPVLIGETQKEIKPVFTSKAKIGHSPLFFADELISVKSVKQIHKKNDLFLEMNFNESTKKIICDLPGLYQTRNIKTVLSAIAIINSTTAFKINSKQIVAALKNVKSQTGLMGRWQILKNKPLVIADTGHNEAGIKEVIKNIKNTKHEKLHFVLGMVNDKEVDKILQLLPKKAIYYFCKASIPRALDEALLKENAQQFNLKGNCYTNVQDALFAALQIASSKDLIFIGGSTFTVADALKVKI
jgi:dihydrofolate synthase/folylpolyglutamate synthase